jgi:hypothetical protein
MSQYGRIHESIYAIRKRLADELGVAPSDLIRLSQSIQLAAQLESDRQRTIGSLLSSWADLEAEAARLGEP